MIHRVYSTLPKFKELHFKSGLNLLLADKSPGATDKQTRNGAGKTSLVELIHFLLGADCEPKSIFRTEEMNDHIFGILFTLGDGKTSVQRTGSRAGKVTVKTDHLDSTYQCLVDNDWDGDLISNTKWRNVLGSLFFGLRGKQNDEVDDGTSGPSFRSLISYFVRRQSSVAFTSPIKNAALQQIGDYQVAISFLLGLDWTIPQQWQHVRARERALKLLKNEAAKGNLGSVIGTTADLRTQLTVAEEKTKRLRANVASFRVLPEYEALEAEATTITKRLSELSDLNTIDLQLIADLETSFRSEQPPQIADLEGLYREAGIVLPNAVGRRFEDVRRFHDSVVQNRKSYLGGELESARRRMAEREGEKKEIGQRLTEVMSFLKSHGALDQYSQLQAELNRQEAQTEAIRIRFASAVQLESEKTELDIERDHLLLRLRQDYSEQEEILRHAIVSFEEISSSLYENAGSLTIDASKNGPQFEVKIHGDKSKGINNVQIFCFDMMIMKICSERGIGPGFLVHDSHLFDGVDERQVGKALEIGAKMAEDFKFQYIVTLNSDAVPASLPQGFALDGFILPVSLTDATEDGGLFGVRFG